MALQKSIVKNIYGKNIIFEDAYLKIGEFEGSKESIKFNLLIFDKTKTYLLDSICYCVIPTIEDSSSNFIKQGYIYLKSLPDYSDAVDILEDGQVSQ